MGLSEKSETPTTPQDPVADFINFPHLPGISSHHQYMHQSFIDNPRSALGMKFLLGPIGHPKTEAYPKNARNFSGSRALYDVFTW